MFVFFTNICMADGAYFSRVVEQDHSIPYQRAIVRFKDNRETLIVESFNQGAQGDYIWVVPVPEKPRRIEAVSPGTIETLVAVMGPEIVSLPTSEAAALCFGLLAFTAYLFAFPVGKKGVGTKKLRTVLFEGFALFSVVTICSAILTPVFASPTLQSVDVHSWGLLGSYDVDCVSGPKVAKWLETRGFRPSAHESGALQDYVDDGWSFVVAKLHKTNGSILSPHPLRIEFDTSTPLYPMRLTFATEKPLALDLVVIADLQASVPGMACWCSSLATLDGPNLRGESDLGWSRLPERWLPTNHPQVTPLLWAGCCLTRLHGQFGLTRSATDFDIKLSDPSVGKRPVLPRDGIVLWIIVAGSVLMTCLAVISAKKSIANRSRGPVLPSFTEFAVTTLAVGGLLLVVLDRYEFVPTQKGGGFYDEVKYRNNLSRIRINDVPEGVDLAQSLKAHAFEHGGPVLLRDVPGGMTVERVGDMWVVKAFDKFGDPAIKTVKVTKKEAGHKSRQPEMIAALDRPWIPLQPSIVRFRTLVWRLQRHL